MPKGQSQNEVNRGINVKCWDTTPLWPLYSFSAMSNGEISKKLSVEIPDWKQEIKNLFSWI